VHRHWQRHGVESFRIPAVTVHAQQHFTSIHRILPHPKYHRTSPWTGNLDYKKPAQKRSTQPRTSHQLGITSSNNTRDQKEQEKKRSRANLKPKKSHPDMPIPAPSVHLLSKPMSPSRWKPVMRTIYPESQDSEEGKALNKVKKARKPGGLLRSRAIVQYMQIGIVPTN
jgi:hypothetical protein